MQDSGEKTDYRQLFALNLDAGIVIWPVENRILDVNQAACELLGYSQQELVANRASTLFGGSLNCLIPFTERVLD